MKNRLIICEDTVELRQIALSADAFDVVPAWPHGSTLRDIASTYFTPIAMGLTHEDVTVVLHGHWRDRSVPLDEPRRRLLDRAGLTLGMVRAHNPTELRQALDSGLWVVQRSPGMEGPGAGAWSPGHSTLIVCDRPNQQRSKSLKHRLPYTSFVDGGASLWLAQQLEASGINEHDLYWVNGYDVEDRPVDPEFIRRLKPRGVVALGQYAKKWCWDAGLVLGSTFTEVPAPAYYQRFWQDKPYPLGAALKRAMRGDMEVVS